jgi:hypothetical protein
MHHVIIPGEGIREPWKTSTRGYLYGLDDDQGREIIGFHWHPAGRSAETAPRFHLGAGARVGRPELTVDAHLPSGRVSVEEMLRMAITVFEVKPIRPNWEEVLDASQRALSGTERGPLWSSRLLIRREPGHPRPRTYSGQPG